MSNQYRDIDQILAIATPPRSEPNHYVASSAKACFTWEYDRDFSALDRLYEKAKRSQWNGTTDLPWHLEVDPEREAASNIASRIDRGNQLDWSGTPVASWAEKEWLEFSILSQRWSLSQFLHGEQGALLCTSRLVETVPWYEAKLYGSTQVVDEARHVEVFARYTKEKLGGEFQINAHLSSLLDDILEDQRWDMVYLGMQVMVEGLALAAFGYMQQLSSEPLLKQLLKYVMADEARHVAFGTISLAEAYKELTDVELKERAEFAFEASVRMRDRFLQQEVWEHMGVSPRLVLPVVLADPDREVFQSLLFSKIVPNCKKLGLLDASDGWLRKRFTDLGVIGFEHSDATDDEVLLSDLYTLER
jgi:hypothetical protein